MKITKTQLLQIIKEEVQYILNERITPKHRLFPDPPSSLKALEHWTPYFGEAGYDLELGELGYSGDLFPGDVRARVYENPSDPNIPIDYAKLRQDFHFVEGEGGQPVAISNISGLPIDISSLAAGEAQIGPDDAISDIERLFRSLESTGAAI